MRKVRLRSIAFDTSDHRLYRERILFRVRREGRKWRQAVSWGAGAPSVTEIETKAGGPTPILAAIKGTSGERVRDLVGDAELLPVLELNIRRNIRLLGTADGGQVELALDEGSIRFDSGVINSLCATLTLASGDAGSVLTVAEALFADIGFRFGGESGSMRAFHVLLGAQEAAPLPEKGVAETITRIRKQEGLTREARKFAIASHRAEKSALNHGQKEQFRREWQALRELFPPINWHGFLQAAAEEGNVDAVLALRRREGRFVRAIAVITPGNAGWPASPIVKRQFRPQNADKRVTYRTGDGGCIVDYGEVVDLPGDTREAVLLTFSILAARFPGHAIALRGDDAFLRKAVQIAASENPEIRFADPVHEAERARLAAAKPEREGEPRQRRAAQ